MNITGYSTTYVVVSDNVRIFDGTCINADVLHRLSLHRGLMLCSPLSVSVHCCNLSLLLRGHKFGRVNNLFGTSSLLPSSVSQFHDNMHSNKISSCSYQECCVSSWYRNTRNFQYCVIAVMNSDERNLLVVRFLLLVLLVIRWALFLRYLFIVWSWSPYAKIFVK